MPHLKDNRPRTVVVLQYAGIGDLIWHIQYFRLVADQSHDGKVTIVAQPSTLTRAFIGHESWVQQVIEHDHRPRRGEKRRGRHAGLMGMWNMARELQAGGFDRIILFSGRPSRGLIAWLSRIPVRQGFGYRWLQRLFLNHGPYIPAYRGASVAVYREASAFMVAHGYCTQPVVPALDVPADLIGRMQQRLARLRRPLYAFAIGTSETHKQWGVHNYAALAQALIDDGCGVMLSGGPAEVQLAQDILTLLPQAYRREVETVTDVPVLGSAAALKVADYCVGNDTGMVNVAAAVGRTTFVIIGPRPTLDHDPARLHNIRAEKLSDISVEQVLALLRQHRREAARAPAVN